MPREGDEEYLVGSSILHCGEQRSAGVELHSLPREPRKDVKQCLLFGRYWL